MRIRNAALAGFVLALGAACTPWYHRESCTTRTIAEAREQISRPMRESARVEFLECFVIPETASDHGCVMRIEPADFATLFPNIEFSVVPATAGFDGGDAARVAKRHGFGISGMVVAAWDNAHSRYPESWRLFHNESKDRVIVLIRERDCHSPSEVIN